MTTSHQIAAATTLALACSAGMACAQTTYDASAVWTGMDRSEIFEVTPEHSVMLAMTEYSSVEASDPTSPVHGATGQCFGLIEIRATGVSGDGYCNSDDRDGHRFVIRWSAAEMTEAGAVGGTWELIGGSEKWVGSRGGGSWEAMIDEATRRETNRVSGEITLN